MYVIKMNTDKSLMTTIKSTIYQYERNADTLVFLIPKFYENDNMADCTLLLRYILPNGEGESEEIEMEPEPYNDNYYKYHLQIDTGITSEVGVVELWLTAINMEDNVVLKSGTLTIEIEPSKDIQDYLSDEGLNQLDRLEARVFELESKKADNIMFNSEDSTIQLTAGGTPIGDKIVVSSSNGVGIANVEIIDDELVITMDNGEVKNLGTVVGKDGAVYVPSVSAQKVITWTIEESAGEIPAPVDLNPSDEWGGVDDSEVVTDYVWESL